MDLNLLAVIGLVLVALIFDYINGFHDAANSIATVVSTRVLSARQGGHVGGLLQLHPAFLASAPPSPRQSAQVWLICPS